MGKTESPLTQQKLKHFNTVGSVQVPLHQSAIKRSSIQNVNPILEEVKLSSESTQNLEPPQFKQPFHNKFGMMRMGTIGVKRFNKFDQKLQHNTNNDAQSYYSSQSQFILGSLYDKQSVAGGSQTVNEGGLGIDRINNMIIFQQRNQSPQQRSPGGGSNPTNGELDLIAPVYSPAFAHQRTEIFKDRKQKVNTIFNEKMMIQVIAEKQKNQTAESKSGVSGMSAINDCSQNGSSDNVFHQMSVSQNSSSNYGQHAIRQGFNNKELTMKTISVIQSRDINQSESNSVLNQRHAQYPGSSKRSIDNQTSYFPNMKSNKDEFRMTKQFKEEPHESHSLNLFRNLPTKNLEGSLYNFHGTFENHDLGGNLIKHHTLKHIEQQPIYIKQDSNITFLKAQQSIISGSGINLPCFVNTSPRNNNELQQEIGSPNFNKYSQLTKKNIQTVNEIKGKNSKLKIRGQSKNINREDTKIMQLESQISSFCTDPSLEDFDIFDNNLDQKNIENEIIIKPMASNKKLDREKAISKIQNTPMAISVLPLKKEQPQTFQDWANEVPINPKINNNQQKQDQKQNEAQPKYVIKPSIIIVPPNQDSIQSERKDIQVGKNDSVNSSSNFSRQKDDMSTTNRNVLVFNYDQSDILFHQEITPVKKPRKGSEIQKRNFQDLLQKQKTDSSSEARKNLQRIHKDRTTKAQSQYKMNAIMGPITFDQTQLNNSIGKQNRAASIKAFSNISSTFKRIQDANQRKKMIIKTKESISPKKGVKTVEEFSSEINDSSIMSQTPKTNEEVKIQILSTPDDSSQSYYNHYNLVNTPCSNIMEIQTPIASKVNLQKQGVPVLNLPKIANDKVFQVIKELPEQEQKNSYNGSKRSDSLKLQVGLEQSLQQQNIITQFEAMFRNNSLEKSVISEKYVPTNQAQSFNNLSVNFDMPLTVKNKNTNNFLIFRGGKQQNLNKNDQQTSQKGRVLFDHRHIRMASNPSLLSNKQSVLNIINDINNTSNITSGLDDQLNFNTVPAVRPKSEIRNPSFNNSLIVPDNMFGNNHTYKYCHNAPAIVGRNLIKSIKQVSQNKQDTNIKENMLQEVRINQLKEQLHKQLKETNNILIDKNLQAASKIQFLVNKDFKRRFSQFGLQPTTLDSSNNFLIFDKNTQLYQKKTDSNKNTLIEDDRSDQSKTTPFNLDSPFYIKSHYEQMISPESSDRTPQATSVMDQTIFNPADYTYEIQEQDQSQLDYETSMISKDDTLSYMQLQNGTQDFGYFTDNQKPNVYATHTPYNQEVDKRKTMMSKYHTQKLLIKQAYAGGTTTHQQKQQTLQAYVFPLNQTKLITKRTDSKKLLPVRKTSHQQVNNGLLNLSDNLNSSSLNQPNEGSNLNPHVQLLKMDDTPKNSPREQLQQQETNFSQMSSNFKGKDLNNDEEDEDFSRAQTQAQKNNMLLLQNTLKDNNQLKHLSTSPKVDVARPITKSNLMTLPLSKLASKSLTPNGRQDQTLRSQRSVTTISAISTKVNGKKIINQYIIIQKLGKGKFAKVVQCMDQNTKEIFAMKILNKVKLKKIFVGKNKFAYQAVETEIAVLKLLEHENIVHLYEIIDDPKHDKLYLIQEFVANGTLQQRITNKGNKNNETLTEEKCRKYFRQLILAVEYCHENAQIIHRDIKPENILIDNNENVKLSDFGVSFMMENGSDSIETSAGSYYYFSPEACLGSAYKGRKSDIWACGVTLYFMIYKCYPFESSHIPELFKKIQNEEPTYRPAKSQQMTFEVNNDMKELLKNILIKNPEKRLSTQQIKKHPWITHNGAEPMPELQHCEIEPTDADKQNLIKSVDYMGTAIMRKISQMMEEGGNSTNKARKNNHQSTNSFLNIMKSAIAKSVKGDAD